jgi:hypothetical protein
MFRALCGGGGLLSMCVRGDIVVDLENGVLINTSQVLVSVTHGIFTQNKIH